MPIQTGRDIEKAAELILLARSDADRPLAGLPEFLRPANLAHAYGIQQAVSRSLGAIGGWVIWELASAGSLACAPLPLASIHTPPTHLASEYWTYRRVMPRICLRVGTCLPDYDAPYSRERIIAAIESCHAAAEVRQPRFAAADAPDALTALADSNGYGCLVYDRHGLPLQNVDLSRIEVRTIVGDTEMCERAVAMDWDMIEAVRWLANDASCWAGGLMVGHLITVPVGTGEIEVPPDVPVRVIVGTLGSMDIQFDSAGRRTQPADRHAWNFWQGWRRIIRARLEGAAP